MKDPTVCSTLFNNCNVFRIKQNLSKIFLKRKNCYGAHKHRCCSISRWINQWTSINTASDFHRASYFVITYILSKILISNSEIYVLPSPTLKQSKLLISNHLVQITVSFIIIQFSGHCLHVWPASVILFIKPF